MNPEKAKKIPRLDKLVRTSADQAIKIADATDLKDIKDIENNLQILRSDKSSAVRELAYLEKNEREPDSQRRIDKLKKSIDSLIKKISDLESVRLTVMADRGDFLDAE